MRSSLMPLPDEFQADAGAEALPPAAGCRLPAFTCNRSCGEAGPQAAAEAMARGMLYLNAITVGSRLRKSGSYLSDACVQNDGYCMTTDTDRSAAGDAQPADHETALLRQELQTLQRRLQTLEEILAWQYLPSPLGPLPPDGGPPHDYLSLAAIVRDEGPYLREWLSYHRLIGVERFYIYDNESRDDTRKLLEPWIERGLVIYRYVAGNRMQMPAYSDAVYSARFTTQWLALLDADEFLVPLCGDDLRRFLRGFEKHPALGINWIMFDSNGHDQPPTAHGGAGNGQLHTGAPQLS